MKIGILGAGQLGMMLAQVAKDLGHECIGLDPAVNPCASKEMPVTQEDFELSAATEAFAKSVDCLTYEFENIPVEFLRKLAEVKPVFPNPDALSYTQDRLKEKGLFQELGIATNGFQDISKEQDLESARYFPAVLKTRRLGYDGKGQARIANRDELPGAWVRLQNQPCLLEELVSFDYEVSQIASRGRDGSIEYFPVGRNSHQDGILAKTEVPAGAPDAIVQKARDAVKSLLEHFDYVGTVTIEFFVQGDRLIANEIAPRVHNSGHWTIEAKSASQFENHIRAITGMPLAPAMTDERVEMINIIGDVPDLSPYERDAHSFVHLYGKEPRPGRKIGHITKLLG